MPTGHSTGGGSSHGGGSFGGSSHGGGVGGQIRPYGRGVVIINNRPHGVSGKASAGVFICIFLAFVFIFVAFAGGIMMANANGQKTKIEYDFNHYKDLVALAQNHSDRIVEGEIKSIEYGYGRCRVIYEFLSRSRQVEGYSFYVYTPEKLSELGYIVGGKIELALDASYQVFGEPDSTPTDIVKFKVSDDGEYLKADKNFKIGVAMLAGGIALIVVCFIASAVISRKTAKPYEGEQNPAPKEKADETLYCEYCGARLKKDDDKCPECGARHGK